MVDIGLDILQTFAEAQRLPLPPRLKRKWWWKPNTQASQRYAMESTPADHTREHPEYKHWCCVCRQARKVAT